MLSFLLSSRRLRDSAVVLHFFASGGIPGGRPIWPLPTPAGKNRLRTAVDDADRLVIV